MIIWTDGDLVYEYETGDKFTVSKKSKDLSFDIEFRRPNENPRHPSIRKACEKWGGCPDDYRLVGPYPIRVAAYERFIEVYDTIRPAGLGYQQVPDVPTLWWKVCEITKAIRWMQWGDDFTNCPLESPTPVCKVSYSNKELAKQRNLDLDEFVSIGIVWVKPEQVETAHKFALSLLPLMREDRRKEYEATYAQTLAFEAKRNKKFAKGEPVILSSYMTGCDGSEPQCDQDCVTHYLHPDGSTTVSRTHTH